jgi:tetrahydromethanopterin S-methyltransferase subunit G
MEATTVDRRFDEIDKRFDKIEDRMDVGFNRLNDRLDDLVRAVIGGFIALTCGMIAGFVGIIALVATQL